MCPVYNMFIIIIIIVIMLNRKWYLFM